MRRMEASRRPRFPWLAGSLAICLVGCGAPPEPRALDDLMAAERWVYVLQGLDQDMFAANGASPADVAVIDDVGLLNDTERPDVDVPAEVRALRETAGSSLPRKRVLAYVDIGQAEENRAYFQDGWKP